MRAAFQTGVVAILAIFAIAQCLAESTTSPANLNLARFARASASSEHNGSYAARFAIDGKIPFAGSQDDIDRAWCVQGNTHRNGAEFTLEWTNAITVAEIVYHGRTAWFAEECWKDYEVRLDDSPTVVAKGQLQRGHGPQHIRLGAPAEARKLTLTFTSSYGGLNPGASEIQVFAAVQPEGAFAKFRPLPPGRPELVDEDIVESQMLRTRLMAGLLGFNKLVVIQRRELNPSHVYTYHVEGFGAGGGLYIMDPAAPPDNPQSAIRNPQLLRLVSSSEGHILDCDLSYDAKEILFSWRRKQSEGYHVFAINTDGTNLRQLTDGPHHNYNACWLPDGGIAFLSTRTSRFAYCWVSPVGVLHRMERDGSRVTQLSANIVNDFTPSVLDDGRIIYSRWEYVDKPAIPIQSLWTIHPDGTGLAGFFGNRVLSPATFMEARSIPGRRGVLCVLTSHNGPCRGAIGIVEPAFGNNAPQGIENLTPEVAIGLTDKGDGNNIRGPYESPYPLDDRHFLVSKRGTLLVRDYAGTEAAVIARPRDGLGFYSAKPLRPRAAPPLLASGLASNEPHDSATSSNVQWATVVLQDVYRGLEPQVKRGEVKEIAVIEEMRKAVRTDVANRAFGFQFPVISCGATYAGKTIWGYAPVATEWSGPASIWFSSALLATRVLMKTLPEVS